MFGTTRRVAIGVLILATLPSEASARQDNSDSGTKGGLYRRTTKPLYSVSLDLENGQITRGPKVREKGFSTCSSFNNNDFSGFVGVDSGPTGAFGPCEWIDAGIKSGGKSGFMGGFSFAYCSAALDPNSGGAGGACTIGFRVGYEKGAAANDSGPSGTEVFRVCLTGLPANTSCSSFLGGFTCYLMEVGLGNSPFALPDGQIGWSWQFKDLGTDGVLAKTFPFLSCVQSCTGNGPDGTGMVDCIDQYCPSGTLLSTFQFGTTAFGGYFTSLSMEVREYPSIVHETIVKNGTGVNPLILSTILNPTLGSLWLMELDCSSANPNKLAIFRIAFNSMPPLATAFGELIVSGPGRNVYLPHFGEAVQLGILVPVDPSFACLPVVTQAFCGDSPVGYLSNAVCEFVGIGTVNQQLGITALGAGGATSMEGYANPLGAGNDIQLVATLTVAGVSVDVTELVTWSSSNLSVGQVDPAGVFRGSAPGATIVTADYESSVQSVPLTIDTTGPLTRLPGAVGLPAGSAGVDFGSSDDPDLRPRMIEILDALEAAGVQVDGLRSSLSKTHVHEEGLNAGGVVASPEKGLFVPANRNGWPQLGRSDTQIFIVYDGNGHIVFPADASTELKDGNLFSYKLTSEAETAVHEMVRALIFWERLGSQDDDKVNNTAQLLSWIWELRERCSEPHSPDDADQGPLCFGSGGAGREDPPRRTGHNGLRCRWLSGHHRPLVVPPENPAVRKDREQALEAVSWPVSNLEIERSTVAGTRFARWMSDSVRNGKSCVARIAVLEARPFRPVRMAVLGPQEGAIP